MGKKKSLPWGVWMPASLTWPFPALLPTWSPCTGHECALSGPLITLCLNQPFHLEAVRLSVRA